MNVRPTGPMGKDGFPVNPRRWGEKVQNKSTAAQLKNVASMSGIGSPSGGGLPSAFKLNSPAIHMKYGYFTTRNRHSTSGFAPYPGGAGSPLRARGQGVMGYIFPNEVIGAYPVTAAPQSIQSKKSKATGFHTDRGRGENV